MLDNEGENKIYTGDAKAVSPRCFILSNNCVSGVRTYSLACLAPMCVVEGLAYFVSDVNKFVYHRVSA